MISKATSKYLRVSPTKVRYIIDLVRGKDVPSSLTLLAHMNKPTKEKVVKVLVSAIANAKQKGIDSDHLYISKIVADQGPSWRRFRSAPFGRAVGIQKKTTHLHIELDLKKQEEEK